jgi:type IV pilus assembly protein PilK
MDNEQFGLWQSLLEHKTGMLLPTQRRSFLETSVGIRMREIGCVSFDIYYHRLLSGLEAEAEWATLVDRLTVQETRFFRHASSYDLLRDYCVRRLTDNNSTKPVTLEIWSVGCATGEEPYSIAMTIDDLLVSRGVNAFYGITATDISLPALAKGRQGIYSSRRIESVPDKLQRNYFTLLDKDRSQVAARLREHVCFARINILDLAASPLRQMDIIFCQNVLIYFQRWRKRDIVNELASRLAVGGIFILGVGEVLDWRHADFERVDFANTSAYIRRA